MDNTANATAWIEQHKLPSWRIEQGGNVVAEYDENDDLSESMDFFSKTVENLPGGTYKVKAKRTQAKPANNYLNFTMTISPKWNGNRPEMQPGAGTNHSEIFKMAYEKALYEMRLATVEKEVAELQHKIRGFETLNSEMKKTLDQVLKELNDDDDSNDPDPASVIGRVTNVFTEGFKGFSQMRKATGH